MAWMREISSIPESFIAGLCYAFSSTCLTLVNKYVFSRRHFHYPWFTLAFQNLISILTIILFTFFQKTSRLQYRRQLTRELRIPLTFFILFIFSNAQALRHMNLPILTVFKSLGPIGITLFERFYFHDHFRPSVYISMILIILSAFVTAIYDLEFTVLGYFWALVNVLANIFYLASLRFYVSDTFTPLEKTYHSNLLSLIPILPISLLSNEFPQVLTALAKASPFFLVSYTLSGVLTLGICASAFWCITTANGSTLSFIGGFNKIPIVILGAILFETKISTAGWMGVLLGIGAGMVFMGSKAKGKVEKEKTEVEMSAVKVGEDDGEKS